MSGHRLLPLLALLAWMPAGHGASVTTAWNPSPGGDAAGYFLYVGKSSRQYDLKINVADATSFTVRGLPNFSTYYFAVTAYGASRVESGFSNEVGLYVSGKDEGNGTEVIEYHDSLLNRYFVTADPQEQATIENEQAGRWRRTGLSFKAGGTVAVCRFHGNTRINPSTGELYGPITYYYTPDMGNCNFLNQIYDSYRPSMEFERFDFSTTPAVGGACPPYLVPVYRAYNNGYAIGIESNHRFSTDPNAISEVVAQGWIDEGVRFCAPQ
ncbi:MAG: fibronectin type III domain-containing protein [Rhodocyclaceae bacterium]|nr:MAG: fibronectin type III domain-containing protein [Rhodocyclaceae bacterium]